LIWFGSILLWFSSEVWNAPHAGVWRFVILDLFALIYFYVRWSSPEAQHRQFHFLLMCSYLITTAFYAYQYWVSSFVQDAFGVSPWWYQLSSNVLFEAELLLIFVYALLFRRAKRDRVKYRKDYEGWLTHVGAAKRRAGEILRRIFPKTR